MASEEDWEEEEGNDGGGEQQEGEEVGRESDRPNPNPNPNWRTTGRLGNAMVSMPAWGSAWGWLVDEPVRAPRATTATAAARSCWFARDSRSLPKSAWACRYVLVCTVSSLGRSRGFP